MTVSDVVFNPDAPNFSKPRPQRRQNHQRPGNAGMPGALNFTIWTGKEAPYDVMYEALKKEFA